MRYRFFGKNIEPACGYCELGKTTRDGRMVVCSRKGIVYKHYHCKKFVYQPLKRIPRRKPQTEQFSKEDFSLE